MIRLLNRAIILVSSILLPVVADAADGDNPTSAAPAGQTQVASNETSAAHSKQAAAALAEEMVSAAGTRAGLCIVPSCDSTELGP